MNLKTLQAYIESGKLRTGARRIYIVLVGFWVLAMFGVLMAGHETFSVSGMLTFLAVTCGYPVLGYLVVFIFTPWIWRGFTKG